jgi:hypothetical protein
MKRIILMLTVAAFLVAALTITAPLAFAGSSDTCTNNGCKDKGTVNKDNTGSPSGNDKDTTPFSTDTTTTTQNNSEKNPNKVTTTTCVLLPNGENKPGQDPPCD